MATDFPPEIDDSEFDFESIDLDALAKAWEDECATTVWRTPTDLRKLEDDIRHAEVLRISRKIDDGYAFDGYEVYRCKRGGMGMVLEAWHPVLERKEALKLWLDRDANALLVREAKTLARLRHPNVVTVYGTGMWNERRYFMMEWIEGRDAQDWIDEDRDRSWREALDVYLAAGEGLAAAHAERIHHRDFKPSNILIGDDGRVCVADFGVADKLRSSDRVKFVDYLAGTSSFMAPERLRGREGDALSDQFSFCVSLWYTLHDRMPYRGRTVEALLLAVEDYAIVPPKPGSDVPRWLSRVVRRGLHPDPEKRFANMQELLVALKHEPPWLSRVVRESLAALKIEPSTDGAEKTIKPRDHQHAPASGSPWSRPWRVFAISIAGSVLGTLLVVGFTIPEDPSPPPSRETEETITVDSYQRGLAKFQEAQQAADDGDSHRAFEAWRKGEELVIDTDPEKVGQVSLDLAVQLSNAEPGQSFTAWMAERAAKAFEASTNWTRAAEAAREAAKLYRAAGDEETANLQDGCVMEYNNGQPCKPQSAQPTVPSSLVNGESHH